MKAEIEKDSKLILRSKIACVRGSTNVTNGIPMSFKVLPMVPLVPMVMPMVPLALPKFPMVPLGEPRTDPLLVESMVLFLIQETNDGLNQKEIQFVVDNSACS